MRTPERLPSGRYKVRFRHGLNKAGTGPRQASESFATKREAEQFIRLLSALGPQAALDHMYEGEQAADVPTLDTVAADHIEHLTDVTDGTRKTYTRLWSRTWHVHLGALPANRVSKDEISRAVNTLAGSYSRKSLENQRGLLSGVLDRAVDLGHLSKNPAKGIRLPRGNHVNGAEMQIITPADFAVIIEHVPDHYQTFVRTLYATGMRWGEAVALEVRDITLPNIRVRRALKWSPDNDRRVGVPKTPKGNRTITVTSELHDELRAAIEGKAGTDLVFTAPRGGQILHRTFWSRVWVPAAGHLTPRPRIHDLRHSHASLLLARGIPIHVISRRLGHSKISVTVDTYGHLLPDAQLLAAQASSFEFDAPAAIES